MLILAAWAPAVISILAAIYIAGQITGRIEDQEKTLVDHNNRLNSHGVKLEGHAISIAKIEAWKEGYNAGATRVGAK